MRRLHIESLDPLAEQLMKDNGSGERSLFIDVALP